MSSGTDILSVRFERQPHLVTRRVAGEIILVPVTPQVSQQPCLYTLDSVAAFLWENLESARTGEELVQLLRQRYAVDSQRAEEDVRIFLAQLQEIQAIAPAGP